MVEGLTPSLLHAINDIVVSRGFSFSVAQDVDNSQCSQWRNFHQDKYNSLSVYYWCDIGELTTDQPLITVTS